ncbi:hypothetical protein BDQ12DRAFT_711007 [Crucibulum laeve]|uniref:ditrans,polycis-polyprenyl diphosphate synthase [(2E,6E)-farnesyldiphosphate specific] n=1 Tax=Crucibulum laeve TaxID=68775 RepID=A0A5C3M8M2_9AGAR|nr:hypothetical protein BDQ12DRAFT_711007 [Crucibulum laeve]
MGLLAALLLHIIHLVYSLILLVHSFWKRNTWIPPRPLQDVRSRIPKHLAILLVSDPVYSPDEVEEGLVQSVVNTVGWCRTVGIEKLTVYDEHGVLLNCSQTIRDRLPSPDHDSDSSDSEIDYPLTPPASDYSESRPLSPYTPEQNIMPAAFIHLPGSLSNKSKKYKQHRNLVRRHSSTKNTSSPSLTICLISRESSKAAIACAARSLTIKYRLHQYNTHSAKSTTFHLTVKELESILEGDGGITSPDFMIVHSIKPTKYNHTPSELHGFPPWHIRLTEIYHSQPRSDSRTQKHGMAYAPTISATPVPLDETSFREALDEFAAAEMRFGK